MRILIVEDDKKLCGSLAFQLEKEGFTVDLCHDGADGLWLAEQQAHDLILLDRMLPSMSGTDILTDLRKEQIDTPVIMITALGEVQDRVHGLDAGADDYIVKPFAFEELMARIRSICRRPRRWEETEVLKCGDLAFSPEAKTLTGPLNSCSLSRRESDLLELLMKNAGQTLPRQLLIARVWGPETEIEDGNLDNYIHFLRRRFKKVGSSLQLKTIRGIGYQLEKTNVS
ncbi:response regulator transcription factor [Diplocloster agilis]|uniref:Stage 0 sporulation protein A homolog n=1 Tax=Diplocloster agilis TaxID=2850323 RepID=A0A949K2G5_9FIRM|nr:response regulator transcription factor [Diplocloster agilis]MBU9737485.1 response regulator transcription factor [Diplocloster agilis]